jgi:nitrite reductase (NADH) large subunit
MQFYRENAKWLERTYDFVPRLGIERIREIVIDDIDRIAARLDAAMQASVDGYVDPWKEADAPKTPNQFRSTLPVLQGEGVAA